MGSQSQFIGELWVPNFQMRTCYTDEVGFKNEEAVSTNYNDFMGSLTRKSRTKARVIKPPFVFGMLLIIQV